MKFAKLTSTVLAGATLLSILAPTASFAATSTAGSNGATHDNGESPASALPQKDNTEVGISFGDNTHNTNQGYLRLQMVPSVLDFGNHKILDLNAATFTAAGKNENLASNDMHASYDNTEANKTLPLNTTDTDLKDVAGKAWATVVDKQVTRDAAGTWAAGTDSASGSWTLSVKADNGLAAVDTAGNRLTDVIDNASLSFTNTAYGQTTNVFELTNEAQDSTWKTDLANSTTSETATKVGTIAPTDTITLQNDGNGNEAEVAAAAAGEGQGANVFGWAPEDIKLTMPAGAKVNNAIYKANLTWTLSSTVA